MDRTYIMIKPDGVQRGLIGEIIKRFEQKGYKLIAMKLTSPGRDHMEKHYEDLAGKKFFPGLISYMTSGPVCECARVATFSSTFFISPRTRMMYRIAAAAGGKHGTMTFSHSTKILAPRRLLFRFYSPILTPRTGAMVWEGANAVKEGRKMLGATMPSESACGTIRGDFCIEVGRNICHGSDSVDSAEKEIALWFPEGVCAWDSCESSWVYE